MRSPTVLYLGGRATLHATNRGVWRAPVEALVGHGGGEVADPDFRAVRRAPHVPARQHPKPVSNARSNVQY